VTGNRRRAGSCDSAASASTMAGVGENLDWLTAEKVWGGGGGMEDTAVAGGAGAMEAAAGICCCCCWADCGKMTTPGIKADRKDPSAGL
jgi:hypothetical protein